MEEFAKGIVRFRTRVFPRRRKLFERLANVQRPKALFITCADSRVDPALITHCRPGEIFVARNPGNLVPPYSQHSGGVSASIEYAVSALKVARVIICGHSDCGVMKAIRNPESVETMPAVARWLKNGEPARDLPGGRDDLRKLTENSVLVQMDNLRTHPSVKEALATRGLGIHGWVYDIARGTISAYDPDTGRFDLWPPE
jgi:carbonic anhydrase